MSRNRFIKKISLIVIGIAILAVFSFVCGQWRTKAFSSSNPAKLLIVEFVPGNIKYASLHFCSDGRITHTADGLNFSLQPNCNSLEEHSLLEVLNNPNITFNPPVSLTSSKPINPRSYFYINDYLRKEALRYNFSTPQQFSIDIKGPLTINACPPTIGTAFNSSLVDFNFFKTQLQNLGINVSGYDFVAVTYIDNYSLSLEHCPRYANQAFFGTKYVFTAIDSGGIGSEYHLQSLIHEILHQLGASDTYVPNSDAGGPDWCHIANGCPADPDGIPNPDNYPQTKGCIMVPDAAIVQIRHGISNLVPASMDQIVICKKTAQEIGWSGSVSTPTPTPTPSITPTPTPTCYGRMANCQPTPTPNSTPSLTPAPTPTPTPAPITSTVKVVRFSGDPKVYVVQGTKIKWVPNPDVFNRLGLNWASIVVLPASRKVNFQRAKLLRAENSDKVYYITEGGLKRHIPNIETFSSYGNLWQDVIVVKDFELSAIPDNQLIRQTGDSKVYKLENGQKRWIKTAEAFNRLGLNWAQIAPVNSVEINSYPEESAIE